MRMLRIWVYTLYVALMMFFLAACDGGGGGGSSLGVTQPSPATTQSSPTTLSGTVADGYLQGARVFLDRNGNRQYDSGEPMVFSGEGGVFSLPINSGEGDRYSVVVEVIAGETIDEDNGLPVTESYILEAPPGRWQFVSPLTTLVNLEMQKNPTMSLQKAELNVKRQLGIHDDVSLFDDYLAPAPYQVTEARLTHKAAQAVASLMGGLRNEIAANTAGQMIEDQQRLVAYLVSDEILRQGNLIEQALDRERNLNQPANVSNMVSAVEEQIDSQNLNRDKLELYAARIAQNPESWDMEPPKIKQQNIDAGAVVAVDAEVLLVFDKELDPTTIASDAISVRRVGGSYLSGNIDYNANLKQLRFTPDQMLFPDSDYEVVVSASLADELGNRIERERSWRFSTIFDLTPPPLAEIGPED